MWKRSAVPLRFRESRAPGDRIWACHPQPQPGELFSSWFTRLAVASGLTFGCLDQMLFRKGQARSSTSDIDLQVVKLPLHVLKAATGVSRATLYGMRPLPNLYGWPLFREAQLRRLFMPWLLALLESPRDRFSPGMQYCPLCLAEDDQPFMRREWRYVLFYRCDRHQVFLCSRCPECRRGVDHRLCLPEEPCLALCSFCGSDLRRATPSTPDLPDDLLEKAIESQHLLKSALDGGWFQFSDARVVNVAFLLPLLEALLEMMEYLSRIDSENMRPPAYRQLCACLSERGGRLASYPSYQHPEARIPIIMFLLELLRDWPERLRSDLIDWVDPWWVDHAFLAVPETGILKGFGRAEE